MIISMLEKVMTFSMAMEEMTLSLVAMAMMR
jgi:hypothetical protein